MILDSVKLALRITSSAYDDEIIDLIESAKADLHLSGILLALIEDEENVLIKRAIILYCKSNFGYDNTDSEKFLKSYNISKLHLCISQDYTVGD